MKKLQSIDYGIVLTTVFLVFFGTLMVYSASQVWADYKLGTEYFFLIRQLLFACLGLVLMFFVSKVNYKLYNKYATLIFFGCLALLILVLIPGVGLVRGGARSWIGIGAFSIQPSEFMKLGLVFLISKYLSSNYQDLKKLKYIILLLIIIIVVFGIIMLQPDFGTGTVIVLSTMIMLFVAGVSIKYFLYLGIGGLVGIIGLIISAPYRVARITSFLDPWSDPLGGGFQIIQSLYAIAPGGLFGVGLFNSRQKYFYLPEPQTDFIFAIIAEELGFVGATAIILVYLVLIYRAIIVASKAKDMFGQFVALGIASIIFTQVFINIGVVTGLLPVTGITLPMLSYGGSSLIITLFSIGVLLNISRYTREL